jgi:hypothetical protein
MNNLSSKSLETECYSTVAEVASRGNFAPPVLSNPEFVLPAGSCEKAYQCVTGDYSCLVAIFGLRCVV